MSSPYSTDGPLVDVRDLRGAGRVPEFPCRVGLADGRVLFLRYPLRVLPGKRIVGEAFLDGQRVLAKLFVAETAERHWRAECSGIMALRASGIPTPAMVLAEPLPAGGYVVLSEFLESAQSLADEWLQLGATVAGDPAAISVLAPALAMLARMHGVGLAQEDLHLGNFLHSSDVLWVIDGDAVRTASGALTAREAAANLGMLLAQLPAAWDVAAPELLLRYQAAGGVAGVNLALLRPEIERVRAWRLKDYLGKCLRDCTLFAVEHDAGKFVSQLRTEVARLAPWIADPDSAIDAGIRLKSGNTCTVARASIGAGQVVVKRYNLKSIGHALSRFWRPSRAWHSWREAHRLQLFGIATPKPLALVEERFGPLRRRAWLFTEYCAGTNLLEHLSVDQEPPDAEAIALTTLFSTLCRLRISHGDLKATNLLWYVGQVWLIDLDACTQHRTEAVWRKAWQRDRIRLLRNWPEGSVLRAWFERMLPLAT